jgi:peptidylprolyl isomerase
MKRTLVVALALASALTACSDDDGKDKVAQEPTPTATSTATTSTPCTPSGTGTTDLKKKPEITVPKGPAPAETQVIDIVCGTGAEATDGSQVTGKYVGVLYADGKEFDSSWKVSPDYTFDFTVGGNVIPGFSIGAKGMKVGGRREVIIPAKDGYGASGYPPAIPGNAALIFVIDLVAVS